MVARKKPASKTGKSVKKKAPRTRAGQRKKIVPRAVVPTGRFSTAENPGALSPYDSQDSSERERYLPLSGHLDELRQRLLWIIATVVIIAITVGIQIFDIHSLLIAPYKELISERYPGGMYLILRNVPGPMVVMIKLSLMIGFALSLPISISILWGFVAPAITSFTARLGHLVVAASSLLFWSGMYVCWKFIYPTALQFMLIEFLPEHVNPQLSLEDYYSFFFLIHIGSGLAFQMPLILVILGGLGILTTDWHSRSWRIIIITIFVFCALITPPDPVTQLFLALPLIGLYLVSLLIVWLIEKSRRGAR